MEKIYLYVATGVDGSVITANSNFDLCDIYVKDFFGINPDIDYENPAEYNGFLKSLYEDKNGAVIEPEDNAHIGKWLFTDHSVDEPVQHVVNLYKVLLDKEI